MCAWLSSAGAAPLDQSAVPGTTDIERQSLSALGALASSVVGDIGDLGWPEEVSAWTETDVCPPASLVSDMRTALSDPGDVLASIYEEVVAGPNRRRLGTFFTPPDVVNQMVAVATKQLTTVPRLVVDPGAGVGAFSVAAARQWPTCPVEAVDTNVVTLGLLGIRAQHERMPDRIGLVRADYLQWIQERPKGVNSPTLFLGNPPYTRHQTLSAATKDLAAEAAGDLIDSRLAGLAAYFAAATLRALGPEDSMCMVLPASWAEATYGRRMRSWLWEATDRAVAVQFFPTQSEVFPGTRVAAMILAVGPSSGAPNADFEIARIDAQARPASEPVQLCDRTGPVPATFQVPQTAKRGTRTSSDRDTVALGEIARVRRGVATGANEFFLINDKRRAELGTPPTVPTVRRLRHVVGSTLDQDEHDRIGAEGHPRWLLDLRNLNIDDSPLLRAYLNEGERHGYAERYLCRVREVWYEVERVTPPDLIVSPMSKGDFRVVLNLARVVPSNSMYGLYLHDPAAARRVAEWLACESGQAAIRNQARHYSHGLRKLEPGSYAKVRVSTSTT